MDLTPSQLFSLNEMGLPVWALRTKTSQPNELKTMDPTFLQCPCIVMVESHSEHEQVQRLLQAMLFSIGLQTDQFTIINSDQLAELHSTNSQKKILLVLGERFAQSLWGKSVVRGQDHQPFNDAIKTIVSFSAEELLAEPKNKALVWQDLKMLKKELHAI